MARKIKNPKTGRKVLRSGKIGKMVLDNYYAISPLTNRMLLKSGVTYRKHMKTHLNNIVNIELERMMGILGIDYKMSGALLNKFKNITEEFEDFIVDNEMAEFINEKVNDLNSNVVSTSNTYKNGAISSNRVFKFTKRINVRIGAITDILTKLVDTNMDFFEGGKYSIMFDIFEGVKMPIIRISVPYMSDILKARKEFIDMFNRWRDEYEDIRANSFLTAITFKKMIIPTEIMGSSNCRSVEKANNKWHIVNPVSTHNCVFQSIAVCRNFISDIGLLMDNKIGHKKRVNSGADLKRQVKPVNDNYADFKTVQEICDYTRYPIKLYDNIFALIKTFEPKSPLLRYKNIVKYYEIQKVGDHCKALIDKNIINKYYKDFKYNELDEYIEKVDDNWKDTYEASNSISVKNRDTQYNHLIATWDIETTLNKSMQHIPYACAISRYIYTYGDDIIKIKEKNLKINGKWCKKEYTVKEVNIIDKEIVHIDFWGLDCLERMTEYIYNNKEIYNDYTFYAHNGGKYDIPLAIEKAFLNSDNFIIKGNKCVELNGSWIGFTLQDKNDRKFKITFRDSYRLLSKSLEDLTTELEVEHKKLTETINHSDINLNNYNDIPELKTYLRNDVMGLLEVMTIFGKGVYEEDGIDITQMLTGASLSKTLFFKKYYKRSKHPIHMLKEREDSICRESYVGGRVECFVYGKVVGKLYYYDFTSLYPAMGTKLLPYGVPVYMDLNNENILPIKFFGFVQCKVRTINAELLPLHGILRDGKLIFPIFKKWTDINLFSKEINYNQYEYIFEKGVTFKRGKILSDFFKNCFNKKAEYKLINKKAMSEIYKIITNSGYGFWGLRVKDRDGVIICEPGNNEYVDYFNTDKLINMREAPNGYMICRVSKDLKVKNYNVAIAAAISSYARIELHAAMTSIKANGGEVYYCDTDSVICNIDLEDHPDIKKRFQWDGVGNELGTLKNECVDAVKEKLIKLYGKDNMDKVNNKLKELVEAEDGNMFFDKLITTGCKQYGLYKKILIDGVIHEVEIAKCKGYQKNKKLGVEMTYRKINRISKGKSVKQTQYQFRCPKSNYVSESNPFTIRTEEIIKKFRKIYTKGVINGNIITPLII